MIDYVNKILLPYIREKGQQLSLDPVYPSLVQLAGTINMYIPLSFSKDKNLSVHCPLKRSKITYRQASTP